MRRKSSSSKGKKKWTALTNQEKWFIRQASRIELDKPSSAIAEEINRSKTVVENLIRLEGLRTKKQRMDIWKRALRQRHFPAHVMKPEIIKLLNETKKQQNLSLGDIAGKCKVSLNYVLRVNDEEKILSRKEVKELGAKIQAKKAKSRRLDKLWWRARHLIGTTGLSFADIASILKEVRPGFVSRANKGREGEGQIRSRREIYEIVYKQKKTKLFSRRKKLCLLKDLRPYIWKLLDTMEIPFDARAGIIDDVSDILFRKLDYFRPEKGIPVEGFLMHFSKFYLGKAIGRSMKKAGAKLRTDRRGQIIIESADRRKPADAVLTAQTIEAMNRVLDERERHVLIASSRGKSYRRIGKELDVSATIVGKIRKRALAKLRNSLEK